MNDCDCVPGHRCDCWDYRGSDSPELQARQRALRDTLVPLLDIAPWAWDAVIDYQETEARAALGSQPTGEGLRKALDVLHKAILSEVAPYRASPPEYPGQALVPVENLERLEAAVYSAMAFEDGAALSPTEAPERSASEAGT